jgi:hypothetical protein
LEFLEKKGDFVLENECIDLEEGEEWEIRIPAHMVTGEEEPLLSQREEENASSI